MDHQFASSTICYARRRRQNAWKLWKGANANSKALGNAKPRSRDYAPSWRSQPHLAVETRIGFFGDFYRETPLKSYAQSPASPTIMPPSSPILYQPDYEYDTPIRKVIRSDCFNYSITFKAIAITRHVLKQSVFNIYNAISSRRSVYRPNIQEKRGKKSKITT